MFVALSVKVTRDAQDQRLLDSAISVVESRKKVTAITPQQISNSSSVIGFCTLDLMPILLGNVLSCRNGESETEAFKIILATLTAR